MAIGKVIKGEGAAEAAADAPVRPALRPPRAGVVSSDEYEARTEASKIIQEAKLEAERIKAEAEAKREEKFAEGREAGRQEGLAQMTEVLAKAKLARDKMLESAENEAVKLAIKIAEKIIGREVENDPSTLVDVVAVAAEATRNAQQITIRVHPQAARVLREKKAALIEKIGMTGIVSIKEDPEISDKVGCILETPFGTHDARLMTQFELLEQVLLPDTAKKERK